MSKQQISKPEKPQEDKPPKENPTDLTSEEKIGSSLDVYPGGSSLNSGTFEENESHALQITKLKHANEMLMLKDNHQIEIQNRDNQISDLKKDFDHLNDKMNFLLQLKSYEEYVANLNAQLARAVKKE